MESGFDPLGLSPATLVLFIIIGYVYFSAVLSVLADKTATGGAWMAWVPIVNLILMCRIGRQSEWFVLLLFVPLVNIVVFVLLWMEIARVRGKSPMLGLLMVIPLVNLFVPLILTSGPPSNSTMLAASPGAATMRPSAPPLVCPACGRAECVGEDFCGYTGQRIRPPTETGRVTTASLQSQTPASGTEATSTSGPLYLVGAIVGLGVLWGLGSLGYEFLAQQYGYSQAALAAVAVAVVGGLGIIGFWLLRRQIP